MSAEPILPMRPAPDPVENQRDRPEASPPRLLLTSREAAAALSVSARTLWSLTYPRGPIPAVRIGRSIRYLTDSLRAFCEAQQRRAQS